MKLATARAARVPRLYCVMVSTAAGMAGALASSPWSMATPITTIQGSCAS